MVLVIRAAGLSLMAADYFFDTRSVDTGTYAPGADQVRSELGDYLQAMEDADPARPLSVEQWLDQNGWSASDPERARALNTLITQDTPSTQTSWERTHTSKVKMTAVVTRSCSVASSAHPNTLPSRWMCD